VRRENHTAGRDEANCPGLEARGGDLRTSKRDARQWWLNRNRPRDRVGGAAIGGLTIGLVLVVIALALLAGWTVLGFGGVF
jgi:hypothetical protein